MNVLLRYCLLAVGLTGVSLTAFASGPMTPSYFEWDLAAGSGGEDGQLLLGGRLRAQAEWDLISVDLNVPLYFTRQAESDAFEWRNTNRASAIIGWIDTFQFEPSHRGWRIALERSDSLTLGSGALVREFMPVTGILEGGTRLSADVHLPGATFALRSGEITRGKEWFLHAESHPLSYLNIDRSHRFTTSLTLATDLENDIAAAALGGRLKLFQSEHYSFSLVGDMVTSFSRGDGLHAGFSFEGTKRVAWRWVAQAVLAGEGYAPGLWDAGYALEVGDNAQEWSLPDRSSQLWLTSAAQVIIDRVSFEWSIDIPVDEQRFENKLDVSIQYPRWSASTRWTHRALDSRDAIISRDGRVFGEVEARWLAHKLFYLGATWQRAWERFGTDKPELVNVGLLMVGLNGHHD